MFAVADCNSFYASCEKVFRPDLRDRPVVVLSNNDGCVIAATRDAKKLGLRMGVPYFQAQELCARHGVAVFSSNYTLYGDLSRRVMAVLRQYAADIEIYSIDEAFLLLPEMTKPETEAYGDALVQRVQRWTGLPICVGVGPTKTLAKAANRTAKNNGLHTCKIETDADINAALHNFPLEDIWGISSRLMRRLASVGVTTALALKNMSPRLARKTYSIHLEATVRELNGEPCIALAPEPQNKKQIHVSRSFGHLVTKQTELEQAVATYAARVGEKLRRQGSFANSIYVWVATNPFREQDPQYANSIAAPLMPATADTGELIHAATECLRALYRTGYNYKRAGVMALELSDAQKTLAQGNLFFARADREKQRALMKTVDNINQKYSAGTLVYGAMGLGKEEWRMQRRLMSPCYTTQWNQLPKVG